MNAIARAVELDGAFNARAFHAPGAELPWLVRTSALDALTPAGAEALRSLGITRVVDLREADEGAPGAHPLEVRALPIYRFADGVPVAGRLEELMERVIATRGTVLAEVVGALASAPGGVAVHCTIGKDRTGLAVALTLGAAGVSDADIVADYIRSGAEVYPHRRAHVERVLADLDLSAAERAEAWRLNVQSPPEVMEHILDLLRHWGGPAGYLRAHGLPEESVAALRSRAGG